MLVVKEKLTKEEEDKISQMSADMSLEYDVVITCFDYPYDAFQSWETPFLMNVRKEGVKI